MDNSDLTVPNFTDHPSVMLSPPKPLDEIQLDLVCELQEWACNNKTYFGPAPLGPGEGSKGQISLNFNNKVNFKDFLYQTLCVFLRIKAMFFVLAPG